jgi:hypothetical protein
LIKVFVSRWFLFCPASLPKRYNPNPDRLPEALLARSFWKTEIINAMESLLDIFAECDNM